MQSEYIVWHRFNGKKEVIGKVLDNSEQVDKFVDSIRQHVFTHADGTTALDRQGYPLIKQQAKCDYYECECRHSQDNFVTLMYE